MRIISYNPSSADQFIQRIRLFLMQNECENCFMLGLSQSLTTETYEGLTPLLLCIESGDHIAGVAVQTRPNALAVTRMPAAAISAVIHHLGESNWTSRGFVGPDETVDILADQWASRSGKTKRLVVNLRVYQLTAVTPAKPASGKLITANQTHLDLLTQWHDEFSNFIAMPVPNPRQGAQKLIDTGRAYLWEDAGKPRSIAATAGPTPNGIRINHVYTPPEFRGRGYASNIVAALSQHMLQSGRKFCFLFTDQSNPTSNKIYQQIGYRPQGDFRHWVFEDAAS